MNKSTEVTVHLNREFGEILTQKATQFIAELQREFGTRRKELLEKRIKKQASIDAGEMPDFLTHTDAVRGSNWQIKPVPEDLKQRRVEITGPTDRKMVINALNSGADTFMADFEDSNAPTWKNLIEGQINLRDAINGTIEFTNPAGKHYSLKDKSALLLVRTRGWHLEEKHLLVDDEPISGGIFDFGLYFFHNARSLLEKGNGPYFYLPKLQNHEEAMLWNDIFEKAQDMLEIPRGTIKATVLIEHILAAFETEEILYALKDHSSGLNCGRWDYIFSFIKTFRNHPNFVLPDRSQITMDVPFMKAYCQEVIRACHKRGAHAMGGMAAQIPIKNDPEANEQSMEKVRLDKEREVDMGHDGTWVAHPGLIEIAMKAFEKMPVPNQINRPSEDHHLTAKDLLEVPKGTITREGLRINNSVGVQYLEAWLRGNGCVPLYNLMEDAATAEISRTQIWQWIHCGSKVDGIKLDNCIFQSYFCEDVNIVRDEVGLSRYQNGKFDTAVELFQKLSTDDNLADFLTIPAYELL